MKVAAIGLHKNYNNKSKIAQENTKDFQVKIAEKLDSVTFSKFLKHLHELQKDTLEYCEKNEIPLNPDSFLIFLDKIRSVSHSPHVNELILKTIADIDIS